MGTRYLSIHRSILWAAITLLFFPSMLQAQSKSEVYIWLATECPLSQKYTLTLNDLFGRYSDSVSFHCIFPKERKKAIKKFYKSYNFKIPYLVDEGNALTRSLKATTTPEVVLKEGDKILYRGAIDNQAVALGKFKDSATQQYLRDALKKYLAGQQIEITETQPIGCLIE